MKKPILEQEKTGWLRSIPAKNHQINITELTEATQHPGKFEGASALAVYLYEQSMNGDGEMLADMETDGHYAAVFTLQGDEPEAFGMEHGDKVVLIEDSQGFVFTIPAADYEAWQN